MPSRWSEHHEANEIEAVSETSMVLTGNAVALQGPRQISAERIEFDNQLYTLDAEGDVVLYSEMGDRFETPVLDLELETRLGSAGESRFWVVEREPRAKTRNFTVLDDFGVAIDTVEEDFTELLNAKPDPPEGTAYVQARGEAETVFFEGHERERLENVRFTSCHEGNDDVVLDAREITLDHATGIGTGKGMKLRFFNVPIFYFPRASFPIDGERKTGFLFPSVGYEDDNGYILEVPWYWNIAPNRDATITPKYLSRRGIQVLGGFRYLSEYNEGQVLAEVLPDDDVTGDTRYAYKYDHGFAKDNWLGRVSLNEVSDNEYLDDFSNDVELTSQTTLQQDAEIRYTERLWTSYARARGFRTIDDRIANEDKPYDLLPDLGFNLRSPFVRDRLFRYDVDTRAVNFTHTDNDLVEGTRLGIVPNIRMPFDQIYGYLTPKLALKAHAYSLDNQVEGESSDPSVAVPVFSLDGMLFFEREFATKKKGIEFTQTLEPRIFYVYAPEEDQDDIPIFDTTDANLDNFGNLFRDSRFFGSDRVGDDNRLSVGLTSRWLEYDTGRQKVAASIGQVFFFSDREVQLEPDDLPETDSESDVVGEILAQATDSWSIGSFLRYDTGDSEIQEGRIDATFDPTGSSTTTSRAGSATSPSATGTPRATSTISTKALHHPTW